MLNKVDIKNYRGFPSYGMTGLTQVNLLVGKNNSGKTALLEAIQFLVSGGDPFVLYDIATRRGEFLMSRSSRRMIDPSHLFHGHQLTQDKVVSIQGDNGHKPVHIKIVPTKPKQIESDDPTDAQPRYSAAKLIIEGGISTEREDRQFRMTRDGGLDFETLPRIRRIDIFQRPEGPMVRFIGPDSLDVPQLAQMYDEVKIKRLGPEIEAALRILDNNVDAVDFLTGVTDYAYRGSRAGAIVLLKDHKLPIPLGSMGDGMRRILALSSSLACTTDGALLADEIDTGLHYTIMQDMWRMIVKRAKASNVQVFATTHSWDCIEGLSKLCQEESDILNSVSIHKIDRTIGHSIAFNGDSLARMERNHIDPR